MPVAKTKPRRRAGLPQSTETYQVSQSIVRRRKKKPIEETGSEDKATRVSGILSLAMDRFRTVADGESELRNAMKEDEEFRASDQWPADIKADRMADGRPCLTINRIPQFIRMVVNQQRATRPGIQVDPVSDDSDVQTAQAFQGIIRAIERNSDADTAYTTGCEAQVTTGRGYWLVMTEYEDENSMEQVIVLHRIPNPLAVFVDLAKIKADGSDARFGFYLEEMPKNEFREEFGEESYGDFTAWGASEGRGSDWLPEGKVRIAHYWWKETERYQIIELELTNPETGERESHVFDLADMMPEKEWPEDWKELGRRETTRTVVKYAKITPFAILEGNEDKTDGRVWPSKYLPFVQIIGDELNVDGAIDYRGMVRDAKDPQRMYSFWASALTEIIALAPRAPYIGVEGQFSGHEPKWNTANKKSYAYLEVKPVSVAGQQVPLPQRQPFSPEVSSIVQAFGLADNDLKNVMGMWDASLGAPGPEQSGKAILARQRQGELGNSNFMDNLGRAIRYTGKIIMDMLPRVYTPVRMLRILGQDNQSQRIVIHNGQQEEKIARFKAMQGIAGIFDISVGRYDVSVTAGPSVATRRQEAVESMLQLINSYPNAMPLIGDLLVKNMDWPGAEEIAARLKAMVPMQALSSSETDAIPPQAKMEIQKLTETIKQLQQEQQVDAVKASGDMRMRQMDIDSRERIAAMQGQVQVALAAAKASSDRAMAVLEAEFARIQSVLDARLGMAGELTQPQEEPQPPALPPGDQGTPPQTPAPAGE